MIRVLALLTLLCVPCSASAEAPPFYPLQGYLTTDLGDPLDGPISMSFAFYDADIGGVQLWSKSQSVPVVNGVFSVYLGTINPLASAFFNTSSGLWLGITVAGDPEMARVRIGSVPFAAYAQQCGSVAEMPNHSHAATDISGVAFAGQQCGPGQAMSGINAAGLPICVGLSAGGNGGGGGISGSGTTNRIAKFKSSDEVAASIITEYSNKIGINDTSPSRTLDVKGDLQVTGDFYWGGKKFSSSSCVVIGGSSCSSACGSHGMSCYKAFSIDKDNNGSTSCSQSGFKFCCCKN